MKILEKLLEVKKIIALLLTFVFCFLSITQNLSSEFMTVYLMVIGVYFGQSTSRQTMKEVNGIGK